MNRKEALQRAFRDGDTPTRGDLIFQVMSHSEYRVWSRRDIADYFGVSKPVIDRAIAALVQEGLLEENRYQRPNRKHILDWYFGYTIPMQIYRQSSSGSPL